MSESSQRDSKVLTLAILKYSESVRSCWSILSEESTTVTFLLVRAKGSANLPAPPPTSNTEEQSLNSAESLLNTGSSIRNGSSLKRAVSPRQKSWFGSYLYWADMDCE